MEFSDNIMKALDPSTTAEQLNTLLANDASVNPYVAAHPNTAEETLYWLWSLNDPTVQNIISNRYSGALRGRDLLESVGVSVPPADQIPSSADASSSPNKDDATDGQAPDDADGPTTESADDTPGNQGVADAQDGEPTEVLADDFDADQTIISDDDTIISPAVTPQADSGADAAGAAAGAVAGAAAGAAEASPAAAPAADGQPSSSPEPPTPDVAETQTMPPTAPTERVSVLGGQNYDQGGYGSYDQNGYAAGYNGNQGGYGYEQSGSYGQGQGGYGGGAYGQAGYGSGYNGPSNQGGYGQGYGQGGYDQGGYDQGGYGAGFDSYDDHHGDDDNNNKTLIIVLIVVLVLAVLGGGGTLAYFLLRDDNPPVAVETDAPDTNKKDDADSQDADRSTDNKKEHKKKSDKDNYRYPAPADAYTESAFRTPTGNIACVIEPTRVSCSIAERDDTYDDPCSPNAVVSTLTLDTGTATSYCDRDYLTPSVGEPTLEYGETTTYGDYACKSEFDGVTCWNMNTGNNLFIARQRWAAGHQ